MIGGFHTNVGRNILGEPMIRGRVRVSSSAAGDAESAIFARPSGVIIDVAA